MSPGPAALLLGAAGTAAMLSDRLWAVGAIGAVLLAVCLRAPSDRRGVYLFGALCWLAVDPNKPIWPPAQHHAKA